MAARSAAFAHTRMHPSARQSPASVLLAPTGRACMHAAHVPASCNKANLVLVACMRHATSLFMPSVHAWISTLLYEQGAGICSHACSWTAPSRRTLT